MTDPQSPSMAEPMPEIDDLLGALATKREAEPVASIDLEDILGELAGAEATHLHDQPSAADLVGLDEPAEPASEIVRVQDLQDVEAVDLLGDLLDELQVRPDPSPAPSTIILADVPGEIDLLDDILGELPPGPAPEVDPLDDILGELPPGPATPNDALDDILGELAPASVEVADPLDDILGELAPTTAVEGDSLDDILGDIAPSAQPAQAAGGAGDSIEDPTVTSAPDSFSDMEDLLGEIDASASPDVATGLNEADGKAVPRKKAKRKLPSLAILRPLLRAALVVLGLAATHGLTFWLGTLSHVAANPEGPSVGASEEAEVHEPPVEGIARYAGKEFDARIDGKTLFEDEQFRTAVDELVGGEEASGAIDELLPKIRATQPIGRKGSVLQMRGCNPHACGLENLTVHYDIESKRVDICTTRASGEPAVALSTQYDAEGAREVPNCEGYPHPPQPKRRPAVPEEAEPDDPADLTLSASDADRGSLSERIHAELAKMREDKKRKRRYE